jgi:YHS domain-containing protein
VKHVALAATLFLLACNSSKPASEEAPATNSQPVAEAPATVPTAAPAPTASTSTPVADQSLTLVADSSQVCMVNNQFMGREQIPVEVEGKTYFGCCEMCKGRLSSDPSSRSGKDPVSGKLVDKASAVIAKRPSGEVIYFESKETFDRYRTM